MSRRARKSERTAEPNIPSAGPIQAGDQVKQDCFTGAVGADDGVHPACVHGKARILQGFDAAEVDVLKWRTGVGEAGRVEALSGDTKKCNSLQ